MEGPAMEWKMEEYRSDEGGSIWSNRVSLGRKFLAGGVVVSCAPLLVPPLLVMSTIAMICSVPYCLFLASYACTQKLMNTLLPSSAYDGVSEETGGVEKDEYGFEEPVMEENKRGHADADGEGIIGVDETEPVVDKDEPSSGEADPIVVQIEGEESTVTNVGEGSEKDGSDAKSEKDGGPKAEDLPEKKEAHETTNADEKGEADKQKLDEHEGELEPTETVSSTSTEKDEKVTPDEPLDRAADVPSGTGEEKRKNSNKKKKKTGR